MGDLIAVQVTETGAPFKECVVHSVGFFWVDLQPFHLVTFMCCTV